MTQEQTAVPSEITASDLSTTMIDQLVAAKRSFKVVLVPDLSVIVDKVEKGIESAGLRCRVYTEYRAAALGAELLVGGAGLVAAAGIAAHNLATLNPDYEIGKNKIAGTVTVTYKK